MQTNHHSCDNVITSFQFCSTAIHEGSILYDDEVPYLVCICSPASLEVLKLKLCHPRRNKLNVAQSGNDGRFFSDCFYVTRFFDMG